MHYDTIKPVRVGLVLLMGLNAQFTLASQPASQPRKFKADVKSFFTLCCNGQCGSRMEQ